MVCLVLPQLTLEIIVIERDGTSWAWAWFLCLYIPFDSLWNILHGLGHGPAQAGVPG